MSWQGEGEDKTLPPWGYFATAGWALLGCALAILASIMAGVIAAVPFHDPTLVMANGRHLLILHGAWMGCWVAILAYGAVLRGWRFTDYFALHMPAPHTAVFVSVVLVVLVLGYDGLTYLLGRDVIPPFQDELYRGARASGTLPALWFVLVVLAPLSEELIFRGFLFRGWVRKARDVIPGIVLISFLWAIIHVQYDWFGIIQIFMLGLYVGWVRWQTGSTLLTILMHAAVNTWAMLQTIIAVDWMAA